MQVLAQLELEGKVIEDVVPIFFADIAVLVVLGIDFIEEMEERGHFGRLRFLLLLFILLSDHTVVLSLFPVDFVPEGALCLALLVDLDFLLQDAVVEPLVFGEVEAHRNVSILFVSLGCDVGQVSQHFLVPPEDLLPNYI